MVAGESGAKRLRRFKSDAKIAGVANGLGEYFGLDPLLFRVAFIVSLCLGGLGLLVYLVMWIMVPATDEAPRDRDGRGRLRLSARDRKLAGVCGGLGEFFDTDPLLFRVAFVVLFFAWGTGILLYLALWLLMPRAVAAPTAPP